MTAPRHALTPAARAQQLEVGRHSRRIEVDPAGPGGAHRQIEWPTVDPDAVVRPSPGDRITTAIRRHAARAADRIAYAMHALHVLAWVVAAMGVVIHFAFAAAMLGNLAAARLLLVVGSVAVIVGVSWFERAACR